MEMHQQAKGDHSRRQLIDELLEVARSNNEENLLAILKVLEDSEVNCNAVNGRRSTALHVAAGYNRPRNVEILLRHGADVHAKDKGG